MFRFAILIIGGVHNFVARDEFFQSISSLAKNPTLHDMLDKVETFEFCEAGPDATINDFKSWYTELINYRDRLTRNDSGFITSDGELFTYEFDACKYEKFLWEQEERFLRDSAERDYHFNAMDYLD